MELTKLPTEIICEIAGFLDINDIKHLEIILEIKFPHYIFAPKYKKLFTQSINEIDDLRYCINYLMAYLQLQQIKRDSSEKSCGFKAP